MYENRKKITGKWKQYGNDARDNARGEKRRGENC